MMSSSFVPLTTTARMNENPYLESTCSTIALGDYFISRERPEKTIALVFPIAFSVLDRASLRNYHNLQRSVRNVWAPLVSHSSGCTT